MEEIKLKLNVEITVTLTKDKIGRVYTEIDRECEQEFALVEQVIYLMNCLDYVNQEINNKTKQFIKVPQKYIDIKNGLEEEIATYRYLIASVYESQITIKNEDN